MKKSKINPYLYQLIKENFMYIIACLFLFILLIITIKTSIEKNNQLDLDNGTLTKDISDLTKRLNLLNIVAPSRQELQENIEMLNQFIPDAEDYFSIIYALDKLSQKTGFIITSYTVNLSSSSAEELKLSITGTGDSTAFMNFLENYNFSGGRLITSDRMELSPNMSGQITISLAFYNKKVASDYNNNIPINKKIFDDIAALKNKINFSLQEATSSPGNNLIINYPKKTNPF